MVVSSTWASLPRFPLDAALFLDFDGTLVDLAPRPDAVRVEALVPPTLQQLARALDGALAIVSGRPVAEIDHHLQPLSLCAAGVHGVEFRGADGRLQRLAVPDLEHVRARLQALVQQHPGLRLESKPGAIALHYRQAPALETLCRDTMQRVQAALTGMSLLHGKMVLELKPAGASKGEALRRFLDELPFRGRRPWFFGDDVTDESGFEVVQALGGVAVKVGAGASVAAHHLPDPAAVRDWLTRTARLFDAAQAEGATR
jgi:trehalose 6-phosphate phosphatase